MKAKPLFSTTRKGSVSSLGEEALIARIRRWLGSDSPASPAGIGDDCAVLRPARGRELLTVDPLVYGVHFDGRVSPRAAGAKLFKRNLSDVAAMGGSPRAAVVALALDGRVSLAWLRDFYKGMAHQSRRHKVPIVGGDVTGLRGSFVATLALAGESRGRILARTGARVGDWIYVTGSLGRSLASGHHLSFEPRLAEGRWLCRRAEVRAMMDVSDGLAKDLASLTPRGAEPALFEAMLPRRGGASTREALCDGEDYELVFAVTGRRSRDRIEARWKRAFPRTRLSCVGRFVRAGDRPPDALNLQDYRGYEHLR